MGNNQITMGNNQIAMGNNQIANGICPSPTGEVRWGLDGSMRSNNYFPPRLSITNREQLSCAAGLSWLISFFV